jgi:transcriptional regulator with XRE-family HTH domain
MRFRNRVRSVRLDRRLSVAALAKLSGVSTETIFSIERNEHHSPRGSVVLKLCAALNDPGLFWVERESGDVPPDGEA